VNVADGVKLSMPGSLASYSATTSTRSQAKPRSSRCRFIATKTEELKSISPADTFDNLLWFDAPSKKEILDALADGDGQRFVELLVSQFDFMARFIPALDQVLQGYAKSK
jgi:hypothetical protein